MKTGCTSTMKNIIFFFFFFCTVFVPFKMGHFQLSLIIRYLHDYKVVPYGMDLDFSVIILDSRGCMECISRKNDH